MLFMKVQVMSRKLIKPCKPTPSNLRNFKISYLDEIPQPMNFSVLLYYLSSSVANEKLNKLEESLAEILPRFYPLAGRYIKENHLVNCSDQGAEYVEAQVDCTLLEHINGFKVNHDDDLNDLLPCEIYAADEITDPLLAIQVSKFKCGGLEICVSISHRIFDGTSMGTFIDAWTSVCRGDNTETICPVFNSPLLFPSRNIVSRDSETTMKTTKTEDSNIVSRMFLFDKKAISSLRANAISSEESGKRQPSRVRVVSALIIKALARVNQKIYEKSRGLLLSQAVNIRERTIPPLPKYSCGNFSVLSLTECTEEQCQNMEFQAFVRFLSNGIDKTLAACANILSDHTPIDTALESISKSYMNDTNLVWFTDWSKFRFYQVDFGWGKPIWTSIANPSTKNYILLMDNKGSDGIEAWIFLEKKDMDFFEQDEEIKLFTT
ncbi:HXXXD-type acyl-transferase family protein [Forsythia ovata]|uniref:HXXXD-type acyl-transferase family protein n=1 Tax=Forsythia ovata TaxID=205694 RepID=A0ABD1UZT7_9LAMI